MRVFPVGRKIAVVGVLAIFGMASIHPFAALASLARELIRQAEAQTLVSTHAIKVTGAEHGHEHGSDRERSVCHHHPEGCPKNCYCPKITITANSPAKPPNHGGISVPTLSQCIENPAGAFSEFSTLLFPMPTWDYSLFDPLLELKPEDTASPLDRHQDPPQKIPIV